MNLLWDRRRRHGEKRANEKSGMESETLSWELVLSRNIFCHNKKKKERRKHVPAEWKVKHSLLILFLSQNIFCATAKACSCCLSQKSTFSHRAAFLPVGLVAKEIRVSGNDENRLKKQKISEIKLFGREFSDKQCGSRYKSRKSVKYRNSQSLPNINHLIN